MSDGVSHSEPESTTRRLLSLNEAMQQLSTHAAGAHAAQLRQDPLLRAAVERWLQIAVGACIDLAYHLIAERGWTPPNTARGSFGTLAGHGLISGELATRLGMAADMRNILVHEYAEVDLDIVAEVLRSGLPDLRRFAGHIGELLKERS